jgi:hypothetical protein
MRAAKVGILRVHCAGLTRPGAQRVARQ